VSGSRHDPRKGADVLLAALRRLQKRGSSFRACLLSDGPLLEVHRALVARWGLGATTILPGRVDDPSAFLRRAAIFVVPSIQECSGSLSLLEALQAGCAVVSSACDGMLEDLVDGDNALLVPRGDVDGLSAAIQCLLDDEDLRARLGRRARATYIERFSAGPFVQVLRDTYEELLRLRDRTRDAVLSPPRSLLIQSPASRHRRRHW